MTKRAELEEVLQDCLRYLADRYDIMDGDNGPRPNKEMALGNRVEWALRDLKHARNYPPVKQGRSDRGGEEVENRGPVD